MPDNQDIPDNHMEDNPIFEDAREEQSAQVHTHNNPMNDPIYKEFQALFKKKNANVKRRITLTNKALGPVESRPEAPCHADDVASIRKYLKAAEAALDALNEVIDDAVDHLQSEALDPYSNEAADYLPSIMDLRARINNQEARLPGRDNPGLSRSDTSSNKKMGKIDVTLRPDPLDMDATPAIFQEWKQQFLIYARRNGLHDTHKDEQRIFVKQCLTPSMNSTLKRVCLIPDSSTIDDLMNIIEKYISGSKNIMTRRYDYFNCVQRPGETIDDYIVRFREIGDYAGFESFSYPDNMACRLVTGINNSRLRRELFRLPKQDFISVQEYCRSWEASNTNADDIETARSSTSQPSQEEINKLSAYKSHRRNNFSKKSPLGPQQQNSKSNSTSNKSSNKPSNQSTSGSQSSSCSRCATTHTRSTPCPASGQQCLYCKNFGHFSKVCRKQRYDRAQRGQGSKVSVVQDDQTSQDLQSDPEISDQEQPLVNVVDCNVFQVAAIAKPTPKLHVSIQCQNQKPYDLTILPDTGAVVSVMPSSYIQKFDWTRFVEPCHDQLRSVDGTPIECDGTITLKVSVVDDANNVLSHDVVFFVCPGVRSVILSWAVLQSFGVIHPNFPRPSQVYQVQSNPIDDNIILHYKSSLLHQFHTVFNYKNQLLPMQGDSMTIHMKPDIDWSSIKTTFKPRPIPIPLRRAAKQQIDDMLHKGIIKPVSEPTPFISPMLIVPKSNDSIRLVIDYTELNKYVKRPIHPFPSVPEVKAMISPNSRFFATLDAIQGYWQVPLHENSQKFTTFLTPWGRYCFTRAPMGLAPSGDEFCRRGDIAFQGIEGVIKVVDDLLLHAPTFEQLQLLIDKVLRAAQKSNITLSPDKFKIGTSVFFVGLQISADGIRPDPRHLEAISNFPMPKNRTDLRSFFGLVNQFANFSSDINKESMPLRSLLSVQSQWHWSQDHERAFKKVTNLLVQAPVLQYFDPSRETKLLTDASRLYGLGFVLLQKHQNKWALVSCGSRFITTTESHYAVCELEALAIVWAIQKCKIYLMGLPTFTVVTDHRPLVTIFNSSRLVRNDNPRLVRLLQKVAMYTFNVAWVPGKIHRVPDALSRSPLPSQIPIAQIDTKDSDGQYVVSSDPHLDTLIQEAKDCQEYCELYSMIPATSIHQLKKLPIDTHGHVRMFASVWDRLSIDSDTGLILLDTSRIVLPKRSRKRIVKLAHQSHQGISRTKSRLQALYFWPGMTNDVIQTVQSCNLCQLYRPKQPSQPLSEPQPPLSPFQSVSCDLFEYRGAHSLVYVDRFSGWPLVAHFQKSPSSSQVVCVLSAFFKDFGIPVSLRHDGGRQFVSQEFSSFLLQHGVHDELSSAYYPESNGHAEAAVKAMKLLVKKAWMTRQLDVIKFNNSLLEWRNTPRLPGGLSPAQILFNRNLRTLLPALSYDMLSNNDIDAAIKKNYDSMKHAYRNSNSRKRQLPQLHVGDHVRIRNTMTSTWDKHGVIVAIRPGGLSYIVQAQGRNLLRNRILLKKILTNMS